MAERTDRNRDLDAPKPAPRVLPEPAPAKDAPKDAEHEEQRALPGDRPNQAPELTPTGVSAIPVVTPPAVPAEPPPPPPPVADRTPEPYADPPPGEAPTPEDDLREEHLRRKGIPAPDATDERDGAARLREAVREAKYPVSVTRAELDAALEADDLTDDEKTEIRQLVSRNDVYVRGR